MDTQTVTQNPPDDLWPFGDAATRAIFELVLAFVCGALGFYLGMQS